MQPDLSNLLARGSFIDWNTQSLRYLGIYVVYLELGQGTCFTTATDPFLNLECWWLLRSARALSVAQSFRLLQDASSVTQYPFPRISVSIILSPYCYFVAGCFMSATATPALLLWDILAKNLH